MKTLTKAEIYWDTQDPTNEGWAWRVTGDDGEQESGEWDWPITSEDASALADAVVHLAYQHGADITCDDVAVEPYTDGGCATWTAK